MRAYRAGRARDFRELRDVMQALLVRPLAQEPAVSRLLRIMQLLSRIEEGENLDCTFDRESELTPLESAMGVLELIKKEFPVPDPKMEPVKKTVKEAAIIICIKKKEFDKASKIIRKHMAKDPSNQKLRTELLSIIREKNASHPIIRNFSYKLFQQSMLRFLETYMEESEPTLLTVVKKTLNSEHVHEPKDLQATSDSLEDSRNAASTSEPLEASRNPASASEPPEASKDPAETPESPEASKDPAETPESPEASKDPAETPESPEASKDPEEMLESLEASKDPAKTPESPETSKDPAEKAKPPEASEDLADTPELAVASGDLAETLEPLEASKVTAEMPEPSEASEDTAEMPEPPEASRDPGATSEPQAASPRQSERQPPGTVTVFGISVLREAFKTLSDSQDSEATFSKLDETDFSFPKQLSPVSHRAKRQRVEESPASDASETPESPPKKQHLLNICTLLMREDSQKSASTESPDSSQEPVVSSASRPPVEKPPVQPRSSERFKSLRATRRVLNRSEERDTWSDEDELFLGAASPGKDSWKSSISGSKKQRWTVEESEWIKQGVNKYGEGRWKIICKKYPFRNRTAVMIKDRWRTMKKLGLD
ncbi:telomeric repeat-binding factor 2 isoform B [Alligator mississippiensis]|uniref:Telomeric repeat-binding factor 2 isoform B n=1 Tax=Alligator mississippiensis TaxID=8496 RepID=A0A151NNV0_ALLMI|nr:telomeric repeat-binding factor 2 isoform B [Alligator mississippiensis]